MQGAGRLPRVAQRRGRATRTPISDDEEVSMTPEEFAEHLPERPAWMADAVCAQTDPEVFFPEKGGTTRPAKRVCLSCAVSTECLDYALARNERFGIWGGLSEWERRKLTKAAGQLVEIVIVGKSDHRRVLTHEQEQQALAMRAEGIVARKVGEAFGVSETTILRLDKRHRQNGAAA